MKNLTLIIPAKNEKESLPIVLKELKNKNYKIKIIVNRNDITTINSVSKFRCDIIFQDKKGYGNALLKGIKSLKTDFFCIFPFSPTTLDPKVSC